MASLALPWIALLALSVIIEFVSSSAREAKSVKEVKMGDGLWHLACGDVFICYTYSLVIGEVGDLAIDAFLGTKKVAAGLSWCRIGVVRARILHRALRLVDLATHVTRVARLAAPWLTLIFIFWFCICKFHGKYQSYKYVQVGNLLPGHWPVPPALQKPRGSLPGVAGSM